MGLGLQGAFLNIFSCLDGGPEDPFQLPRTVLEHFLKVPAGYVFKMALLLVLVETDSAVSLLNLASAPGCPRISRITLFCCCVPRLVDCFALLPFAMLPCL